MDFYWCYFSAICMAIFLGGCRWYWHAAHRVTSWQELNAIDGMITPVIGVIAFLLFLLDGCIVALGGRATNPDFVWIVTFPWLGWQAIAVVLILIVLVRLPHPSEVDWATRQ